MGRFIQYLEVNNISVHRCILFLHLREFSAGIMVPRYSFGVPCNSGLPLSKKYLAISLNYMLLEGIVFYSALS